MRKCSVIAMLMLNALTLNVLAGVSYAVAEDASDGLKAAVMEPVRGSFSSEETRADRAAKLRAKMKAIEERRNRPVAEKVVVPIEHRNVRGSEQIKAKMEASKGSGKRGTAKIQGYINGFMGGLRSFSDMLSGPEDKEQLSARKKERKMSFKERLKMELKKKQQRNFVREQ